MSVRYASPEDLQRFIARAILGAKNRGWSTTLGSITLREHQADAAERLAAMIERDGGAMLAEPVGVGKTYTALAVAARLCADEIVVAAPASLREMWTSATRDCGVDAKILTHEALSRSPVITFDPRFLIVDESHRLRNPRTRRYASVASLCVRSRVLLVTATPVQNARDDLAAQLALFLGREALALSDSDIARHVVRTARPAATDLPRLIGPTAVALATDDGCVDDLLALPPPVPARDESTAAALMAYGLVHQWTSSRGALVAALERRLARGLALTSILETGRLPNRAELGAWTWSGDAVQLAFPEIVARAGDLAGVDIRELLAAVTTHQRAIESLIERLRRPPNPDDDRASALREIRRRHMGERVIAFCHYAETVAALWSRLRRDPGIAALTAKGARLASGRVSRASVLEQFTPRSGGIETPRAERIDLLIATDVLSEGLNLHEASVVVHLDYPWNPARLDQRVGRVRRLGSRHDAVTVYALAPPASGERLLRIDERLREKLRVAQRTVGVAGSILPSPVAPAIRPDLTADDAPRGSAEAATDVRVRLRAWLDEAATIQPADDDAGPFVAAVPGDIDALIALVARGDDRELVVGSGAGFDTTPATIAATLAAIRGGNGHVDEGTIGVAIERLEHWLDARFGASTLALPAATASRARRAALARVARALSRTPRHRRAVLAPLAHAARSVAVAPLAEGAERVLDSLVESDLPDEAWLRSIAAFGELNVRPERANRRQAGRGRVIAVLFLVRAGS